MVQKIVSSAIKSGISPQEIQILAPMYRGQAGINNLNVLMQELLNPLTDGIEFLFNDIKFRKGDKVLHLVNDAEANVFNGDIGYITDLVTAKYTESKQDEIFINFDGTEVIYPRNDWIKITLAYAMSIHKSQGSEFQVVILPITRQSGRMLQRNLIYTAITRSKSKLVMLGEISAFDYAIKNEGAKRNTYLVERFSPDLILLLPASDSLRLQRQTSDKTDPPKANKDVSCQSDNQLSLNLDDVNLENETIEHRLTEENLHFIDPMIGLTQTDIKHFFK